MRRKNKERQEVQDEQVAASPERTFSRRHLLKGLGVAALAVAAFKLNEGVSLNKPPLTLRKIFVDRTAEGMQMLSSVLEGEDEGEMITITAEGRLLYEPSGEFFEQDKEYSYIHRANDIEFIARAHEMGAEIFDIDANIVDGIIYGDHGLVPEFSFSILGRTVKGHLPMVVDVNEKELKLGAPKYIYEQLVAYIATLSQDERPLAVSTELKRGDFNHDAVMEILAIHRMYNVPVILHSTDANLLRIIGDEIAYSYETAG